MTQQEVAPVDIRLCVNLTSKALDVRFSGLSAHRANNVCIHKILRC